MVLLNKLYGGLASHSTAPTRSPITRVQINKGFRLKRISQKILSFGTMAATSRAGGLECFRVHNFTTDLFAAGLIQFKSVNFLLFEPYVSILCFLLGFLLLARCSKCTFCYIFSGRDTAEVDKIMRIRAARADVASNIMSRRMMPRKVQSFIT